MYTSRVSTTNPGLIQFVLDDSGSTQECFPGTTDPVYVWIERYCGIIMKELVARSTDVNNGEGVIKPRYYLSALKYGSSVEPWSKKPLDIEEAVKRYTEAGNSFGLGGELGGTDTRKAFEAAEKILFRAIEDGRFNDSFAPMLFHLTDGLSQSDASKVAEKIKKLATNDGNVLVVNAFIGTETSLEYKDPEDFTGYTTEQEAGPSEDNIRLFNMSSPMPEAVYINLTEDGIFPNLREDARLFFDVRTKDMLKHVIQVVGSIGSRADRTERTHNEG